jgi:AbiJ N-terminal domain 4
MFVPFSKRDRPPHDTLTYEIPARIRQRIIFTINDIVEQYASNTRDYINIERVYEVLGRTLLREYGELAVSDDRARRSLAKAVVEHFQQCSTELALDFLEYLFRVDEMNQLQVLVHSVNRVFRDEGIGFELTEAVRENPEYNRSRIITYPTVLSKDTEYLHSEVVRPCLECLSKAGFETANGEMLKSHEAYRHGRFDDVITHAGAAFESVLKSICDRKKWVHGPNMTCQPLLKVCRENGLFDDFYESVLVGVCTIRNKLSSAHGKGPKSHYHIDQDKASHMLHLVSSHIQFLMRQGTL